MSDKPLFQNTDEQEQVYAPQQVSGDGDAQRAVDFENRGDDATTDDDVGIPTAGAGLMGQMGGGLGGVSAGTPGAIGPAVTNAAPQDETSGDHPI